MTDIVSVKTGGLTPIGYHGDLLIAVSDPRVPNNDPTKESHRINLGSIRPVTYNWNTTLPITSVEGLKENDFVILKNVPATGLVINDYYLKQDDMLMVLAIEPQVLLLPIISGVRKTTLQIVTAVNSPFNAYAEMDIYVDVTNGPVTINLPTVKSINDRVNILPFKGRYEVNNLTINSTDMIHGMVDSITVDVDNVAMQCVWFDEDENGWLIFGK